MTRSDKTRCAFRNGTGQALFFAASLSLLLYPKAFVLPHVKPYFVILVIVEAAVFYSVVKMPRLLLDKGLIGAGVITLIASISLAVRGGYTMLQDYIWFNYFIVVSFSAYLLLKAWAMNRRQMERVLRFVLFCSFIVCGMEFYEIRDYHSLDSASLGSTSALAESDTNFRPSSVIGNANPLATFCAAIVVLTFNRLLIRVSSLDLVAFLVNIGGTLLSLSRGGWVGLLSGLCVSVALHAFGAQRQLLRKGLIVAAICVLIGCLALGNANSVSSLTGRFSETMQDRNSLYRLEQWQGAWRELANDYGALAFGMGPGSAAAYYRRGLSDEEMREVVVGASTFDNTGISILFQYGVLGLVLSLVPFAWLAGRVIRLRDPTEYWRIGVGAVILISCIFYEIFPYFACSYVLCLCFIWPCSRMPLTRNALRDSLSDRSALCRVGPASDRFR